MTHKLRIRILNVIEEYTCERLASMVAQDLTAEDMQPCLTDVFVRHGVPAHVRSDIGPEFKVKQIRRWLNELGASTLFIERGSPWENGYLG